MRGKASGGYGVRKGCYVHIESLRAPGPRPEDVLLAVFRRLSKPLFQGRNHSIPENGCLIFINFCLFLLKFIR
jgi:hypothetical protein